MGRVGLCRALIAAFATTYPTAILAQPEATAARVETSAPSKPADDTQRAVTLAQFEQAAQIAKLAAEQGVHELSQRAIRRALAKGPPLDLQTLPVLGKPKPTARRRSSTNTTTSASPTAKIDSQVSQALDLLAQNWQAAPAEEVYETLAAVVLPEGRPGEIFLYDDFSGSSIQGGGRPGFSFGPSPPGFSPAPARRITGPRTAVLPQLGGVPWPVVSRLLIDAAARAGRLDDLKQRISARDDEHNEFAATILLTQSALVGTQLDLATCWPYLKRLAGHDPPDYATRLLHELANNIQGPEMPAEMVAWLDTSLDHDTAETRRLADSPTRLKLLMAMAHWQFAHGNVDQARRHLKRYAELGLDGSAEAEERDRYLSTCWLRVAREFVRAGLLDDALDALAKQVDRGLDTATEPLVTPVWLGLRRLLLVKLSAADRYKRLIAWTMPEGERHSLRFVSCFVPHDGRPDVFQTDLYRSWPDDVIASNFQLLVEAAREARFLDDLQQRLARYPANESIEAAALYLLLAVEMGREDDAAASIDGLNSSQQAAPADPTTRPPLISGAAFLLTRTCLRSAPLRERGAALSQLCGRRSHPWANRIAPRLLKFELAAATGRDLGLDLRWLSDLSFVHWQIARTADNWMAPFYASPVWAEHSDDLRCVNGASALVLDCPLVGTGEISVDLTTFRSRGSISYGGISIGPYGVETYDNTFPATVIQNTSAFPRVAVTRDVNRWTLHFEPEASLALHNGGLVYDIPQPSEASPWLALCAWSPADAVFRRLTITGDWRIPREVTLIEADRLVGWTTGFYDEPRTAQLAEPARSGFRGRAVAPARGRSGLTARQAGFGTPSPRLVNGWFAGKDGTLHGLSSGKVDSNARRSNRLTYFRPLKNGDVLRYEFYYQPQTMVHPALDRLTFLLEAEGVRLHWMTDHPDVEAGDLPPDNVADEPAASRGPERLPLIERDWNGVVLKLVDDKVLIELNGVLILERKLESANDRRFSFFHYRDQTQAMVRNVVLSGDWPEKLPSNEELFARVRPLSETEREVQAKLVNAEQFEEDQPETKEKTQ